MTLAMPQLALLVGISKSAADHIIEQLGPLLALQPRRRFAKRSDCKALEESGAKAAVGKHITIADGGYPSTGLVMPHRHRAGEELPD